MSIPGRLKKEVGMITRKVQVISLAFMLLLFAGYVASAPAGQGQRSPDVSEQRSASNVLADEMTTLDSAMRETVSAIAQADGARVARALGSVRGPMEKTRQALRTGTFSPPKNGDRLYEFQRSYDSYHAQLDALARAGNQNNVEAMLMITKQLLEGCVTCHRTYWK